MTSSSVKFAGTSTGKVITQARIARGRRARAPSPRRSTRACRAAPAARSRRQKSFAGAREQQLQVVVDLRHRADRRARGAHRVGLVDGDRRRDALDGIDLRLVHAVEELARVRRERLDVAALALGVERVEHERGLARARRAGDDDQLARGDVDVEVLQVVLARAADADRLARTSSFNAAASPAGAADRSFMEIATEGSRLARPRKRERQPLF